MAVDETRKLIYLHPAKTGGTSIAKMFGWYGNPGIKYLVGHDPNSHIFLGTLPLRFFLNYKKLDDIKKYFMFITVRNPYTRAASDFMHRKPNSTNANAFYLFLKSVEKAHKKFNINELISLKGSPAFKNHFIPQYEYIKCDLRLKSLGIRENNIVVLKMENLASDFEVLVNKPLNLKLKMIHANRGVQDKRLYKSFYIGDNAELLGRKDSTGKFESNASIIAKLYKEDFITFNYDEDIGSLFN
jgi:hypothetical protein